jgi:hypothetical protein
MSTRVLASRVTRGIAVTVALGLTQAALAQMTWYVDDDAPNDPGPGDPSVSDPNENGSPEHPFDAIQEGIDAATDGDTVLVLDGTYTGTGNKNLDYDGRAIAVRSQSGVDTCIVDCEGDGRGFLFHSGETAESVLEGLTITNGRTSAGSGMRLVSASPTIVGCAIIRNMASGGGSPRGGGIDCLSNTSPTIAYCTVAENTAFNAAGISCSGVGCEPLIVGCIVAHNIAQGTGGGIACYDLYGCPSVVDCVVTGNVADAGGAGIDIGYGGNALISNCLLSSNTTADAGGGVCASWGTIINCTIADNAAREGGGVYCWGMGGGEGPTIAACMILGNSATSEAGGVYHRGTETTISNCLIAANVADVVGGGLSCPMGAGLTVANCTLAANAAGNGRALACGSYGPGSEVSMVNCVVWDGGDEVWKNEDSTVTITYSDVCEGWPGEGNIDGNPLFADPNGPDGDPNTWEDNDYRVLAGSPCIDAADNEAVPPDELDLDEDGDAVEPIPFDLDGRPRFVDDPDTGDTGNPDPDYPDLPIVDMGAYEFQACPGDLDGDGDTDQSDLGILLADWGCTSDCVGDLNGDDDTDQADLGILLADWGCGVP